MLRCTWRTTLWSALSAAAVLGLNACDRAADGNPNAPGSPATGNPPDAQGGLGGGSGLTGSFPPRSTATSAPMGAGPSSAPGGGSNTSAR